MRILNVKTEGVTRGVYDKDLTLAANLVEVTFEDEQGIPHTVFGHREGPFETPEAIVRAWGDRTLHDEAKEVPLPSEPAPPAGQAFE